MNDGIGYHGRNDRDAGHKKGDGLIGDLREIRSEHASDNREMNESFAALDVCGCRAGSDG
jgi:hypothetical protein